MMNSKAHRFIYLKAQCLDDEENGGFRIVIRGDDEDEESVTLCVKYTPKYPEELPELELEGLESDDHSILMELVHALVH